MLDMSAQPQVTISTGTLRGEEDAGIRRFLGIPYAAPPFGENRFREPRPPAQWDGVRDATAFAATAPQLPYPGAIGELLGSVEIPGDDILAANVWTPSDAANAPVMLWIHGGALERGTPALPGYDGTAFARAGIVFASIGYRLGSEGFSVLDGVPRNLGLRDVAAGLEWVHREISAFGGDPARITVMGESAGGTLVSGLLARDDSRALIARAIIQSGPLQAQSAKKAGRVTAQLAKHLGIRASGAAFSAVSPSALLDARRKQSAGSTPMGGAPGFQLVIDEESLPRSPHDVLPTIETPLLIGTNTDEYRLWFTPQALAGVTAFTLLAARLALRIPARAVRAYRKAWPVAATGEIFGQVATDVILRSPATFVAAAKPSPTFVYEFAWQSPARDLRAAHALELGFVFDTLTDAESQRLSGPDAPASLAAEMNADWVRFIATGDPGWPAFDERRLTRVYDTRIIDVPQRRQEPLDLLPISR